MSLDLSKQVGPLPLGLWLLGVGAGGALYLYNKNKVKPAPTQVSSAGSPTTDETGGVGTGGWTATQSPLAGPSTSPTTNEAWQQNAFNQMVASGYESSLVAATLSKYLTSQPMDAQQTSLLSLILTKAGLPPYPPTSSPVVQPPTPSASKVPNAPTGVSIVGSGTTITVKWVTPSGNGLPITGQSAILHHVGGSTSVKTIGGSTAGATQSVSWTGIGTGQYQAQVQADSKAGHGASSSWTPILNFTAPKAGPAPKPAPVPNPKPVPNSGNRFATFPQISQGSKGSYVSNWQSNLNSAFGTHLAVDGNFGPATAAATRSFQANALGGRLVPDGIVGPKTWAKMDLILDWQHK